MIYSGSSRFCVGLFHAKFHWFLPSLILKTLSCSNGNRVSLQPFFKYHITEKVPDRLESDYSISEEVGFSAGPNVSYTRIIKRIWHYGISIFLVFFISLTVYPAVTVLVESQYKGKGYAWNGESILLRIGCFIDSKIRQLADYSRNVFSDVYFVPVVTYLIFSTGDYVGRVLSGIFQWVRICILNMICAYFICKIFIVLVYIVTAKRQTVARDILQRRQSHFYTCSYVL